MKKSVLSLLLFLPIITLGQVIDHFSNTDSKWHVAKTYPNGNQENPNFIETKTTIYGFQGDSLIEGESWLKLYSTKDSMFTSSLSFEGYIRSVNNLVLKWSSNSDIDTVYDFNLNVGDSIYFDLNPMPQYIPITLIDSVLINNQHYKRFHFAEPTGPNAFTTFNEVWVEGIGSLHSPLFPIQPDVFSSEMPDSLTLICTKSIANDIWQHPDFNSCIKNIVLGIESQQLIDLTIFPNPTYDKITIQSRSSGKKELSIYNGLGEQVLTHKWTSNSYEANLNSLKTGIYFLKITKGDKYQTIKLLKVN